MTVSPTQLTCAEFIKALRHTYLFAQLDDGILASLYPDAALIQVSAQAELFRMGDPSDALYILWQGHLQAVLSQADGSQTVLGDIHAGEIVGEMQILVGGTRTASVCAVQDAQLIRLPKTALEALVRDAPDLLPRLTDLVIRRLRRGQLMSILPRLFGACDDNILREIEEKIEWVRLQRGEALFHQGDVGDSLYIVISGSLQVVVKDGDGTMQMINDIPRGECVGEMAILTGEERSADVYAVRNCELVKFSKAVFEALSQKHPQLMLTITRILTRRLRQNLSVSSTSPPSVNIAVIALKPNVPLAECTRRLAGHVENFGSLAHLNSTRVDDLMGRVGAAQIAPDAPQSIRLAALLDEQETRHRFILYEADATQTHWTEWCMQRADQLLLVADATASPALSDIETTLLASTYQIAPATRSLALIHPNDNERPSGTAEWLADRHVKLPHHIRWDRDADFARLARFLTGRAVGLALSGGGARGFAHFGVYLALKEAGVPVDMIGGTSMGAVLAAQCALEWTREQMLRINWNGLVEDRAFKHYTLPFISLINSRTLDRNMQTHYTGDIEDLWTPFFCVSTNLTEAKMVLHQRGCLWKAIRASVAIPGVLEPVLTDEGHLLVDGGFLNNLPADIMRQFCGTVIAVDVSQKKDLVMKQPQFPTPWQVALSRLTPFRPSPEFPSILDVLMGATIINLTERNNQVKGYSDLFLCPPTGGFKLLEFEAVEQLVDAGYRYAREQLAPWLRDLAPFPWNAA